MGERACERAATYSLVYCTLATIEVASIQYEEVCSQLAFQTAGQSPHTRGPRGITGGNDICVDTGPGWTCH